MTANQIAYQRNLIERAKNAEIQRSNQANESEINRSNLAREAETKRSNIVGEVLSGVNTLINLSKLRNDRSRTAGQQLTNLLPIIMGA